MNINTVSLLHTYCVPQCYAKIIIVCVVLCVSCSVVSDFLQPHGL